MLTFPTLPTDSLYKFLFLGGISLFALSTILANQRYVEIIYNENHIDSAWKADTLKMVNYKKERLLVQKSIESVSKSDEQKLKSLLLKKEQINKNYATDSMRLEGIKYKYFNFYKIHDRRKFDIIMCSVLGMVLTFAGGIGWYYHQQRNQDELTIIQVKTAHLEYESALLKLEKLKRESEPTSNEAQ